MSGYQSSLYAEALGAWGTPLFLAGSGGWLLTRPVPGGAGLDGAGPYPLFCCRDAARLGDDVESLRGALVALSMVMDPFAPIDAHVLEEWFPDVCRPFKAHFVVDLARDWRRSVCRHHRRHVRVAARQVEVERCAEPAAWLETWIELYTGLVRRHEVRGIAAFSRSSFEKQLRVPGMTAFRASRQGETAGMLLWCRGRDTAYYHLGAMSAAGYRCGAAFVLFDVALAELAAEGARWADLGGRAGWQTSGEDGLARFKQGWANDVRTAWFCGRIFDKAAYARLVALRTAPETEYFPAYRAGEAA